MYFFKKSSFLLEGAFNLSSRIREGVPLIQDQRFLLPDVQFDCPFAPLEKNTKNGRLYLQCEHLPGAFEQGVFRFVSALHYRLCRI